MDVTHRRARQWRGWTCKPRGEQYVVTLSVEEYKDLVKVVEMRDKNLLTMREVHLADDFIEAATMLRPQHCHKDTCMIGLYCECSCKPCYDAVEGGNSVR